MNGWKSFLLISTLLLFVLSSYSCKQSENSDNYNKKVDVNGNSNKDLKDDNSLAPNFKLKRTNGEELRLSDYRGKVVLLDFWATWCGPCKRGIPDLIDIQKKYSGKVQVIGISVDADTKPDVIPFIKEFGINYPIVYASTEVIKSYGDIYLIPTVFILDQSGHIVYKHEGLVEKSIYVKKINELLKNDTS